ncbi:MAG: hypothetical protein ACPG8V_00535 [Alphaproteobacteria bacterium]
MKKLLLATSVLAFAGSAFAGGASSGKEVGLSYKKETVNNGSYQTRNTRYTTVTGKIGEVAGGTLTIGYTKSKEDRTKVLSTGKLSGSEKGTILSLNYMKVQPSWGFWGAAFATGEADNNVQIQYVTNVALSALSGKLVKGTTTSDLTAYSVYAGTKVSTNGFDIIPMVKYTKKTKKLKSLELKNPANALIKHDFALTSGVQKTLDIGATVQTKVGSGKLSASYFITDTKGTDVVYKVATTAVPDNPEKRRGNTWGVQFETPINNKVNASISYTQYKNGKTKTKTTFIGVGYKF